MAELRVFNNIFEKEYQSYKIDGTFDLQKEIEKLPDYDDYKNTLVECYDPDTGKTFFAPLEDDDSTQSILIVVNGKSVDFTYKPKENDIVNVLYLPLSNDSKNFWQSAGAIIGLTVGALAGVALMFIPGINAGVAAVGFLALGTVGTAAGYVAGGKLYDNHYGTNVKTSYDTGKSGSQSPDVRGSENQSLTGNNFPYVIGKHITTPFVVGLPYTTYEGDNGEDAIIREVLAVGYAPLKLTDFKLGDMWLAYNRSTKNTERNTILKGILSSASNDIVDYWKTNDVQLEILQQHPSKPVDYGTTFPEKVVDTDVGASLLYVIDGDVTEVTKKKNIVYKNVGFINGLRTNRVQFTESCPLEFTVNLDFQSGLYQQYSYEGETKYKDIPLWLAIQWRFFSDKNDSSDENGKDGDSWNSFLPSGTDNFASYTSNFKGDFGTYTDNLVHKDIYAHKGNSLDTGSLSYIAQYWKNRRLFNFQPYSGEKGISEIRASFTCRLNLSGCKKIIQDGNNSIKGIEVRVIRVSPNYLNMTSSWDDGKGSPIQYSDSVVWKSLSTKTFNEDRLVELIDKQGSGEKDNGNTVTDSYIINNIPQKILSEADMRKLCLVAIKAKADVNGNIQQSLKKINCIAESFSPYFDENTNKWFPEDIHKVNGFYKPIQNSKGDPDGWEEVTKEQYEEARGNGLTWKKEIKGSNYTEKMLKLVLNKTDSLGRYILDNNLSVYNENNAVSGLLLTAIGGQSGAAALGYEDFNMLSLTDGYKFCKSVEDGSTYSKDIVDEFGSHLKGDLVKVKYSANAYIYQGQKLETLLHKLAVCARGVITYDSNSRLQLVIDKKDDYPKGVINQQNCISGTNTYSWAELPAGLQFTFNDENDGFEQNQVYCWADNNSLKSYKGQVQSYNIDFVTNPKQLWSLGRYILACFILQREILTRKVGSEGELYSIGDTILVQDSSLILGDGSARIQEIIEDDDYIYGFIVDTPFNYKAELDNGKCTQGVTVLQPKQFGKSRTVTLRLGIDNKKAECNGIEYIMVRGVTNICLFDEKVIRNKSADPSDGISVKYDFKTGDIAMFGAYTLISQKYRITKIKPEQDGSFTETLLPYFDELYKYGAPLPSFQSPVKMPSAEKDMFSLIEVPTSIAENQKNIKDIANNITNTVINGGSADKPPKLTISECYVNRDGISVNVFLVGKTLKDSVKSVIYELSKDSGATWKEISKNSTNCFYNFDRINDGYPEKEDFATWRVRAKSVNIYGNKSDEWSDVVTPNSDSYKTWIAPEIIINSFTAEKESLKTTFETNASLTYGDIRYEVNFLYDGKVISTIPQAIAENAEYIFDRDLDKDGYPEKQSVIDKFTELKLETKGRCIEKYTVEVKSFTLQVSNEKKTATKTCDSKYYGTWVPGNNNKLTAKASVNGISSEMVTKPAVTEYGFPYKYEFQIKKQADGEWATVQSDSSLFEYTFDKENGEFPEKEDLDNWKIRCRTISVAGIYCLYYTEAIINTDEYGTWKLEKPEVATRASDRTITLIMSQPQSSLERYGNIKYKIQIRRPKDDEEDTWFKPGKNLDPYKDEGNYKNGNGFIETDSVYTQTMPLLGQSKKNIEDTLYQFKITAFNEAGESESNEEVFETALCTNIQDIVKANETSKSAYISELSAITANLGTISQGSLTGNNYNYWNLSTSIDEKTGEKRWQGAMRVGGNDQYLQVVPIIENGEIKEYNIKFKVGNFEITSTASNVNGELIVIKDDKALDRTRITPIGTFYEHRETVDSEWVSISQMTTAGILANALISDRSLIVTNMAIENRRKLGHDIGRPYLSAKSRVWHFDTDLKDQNQESDLVIQAFGQTSLVGSDTVGDLDYTPAILAVAPYSEVAKSLFGQYQITKSLEKTNIFTVDFWLQYIWCENQVLFDIGTTNDKIRLAVANTEEYYNTPLEGEVPYNQEINETGDVVVYNEPKEASSVISHYGRSHVVPDLDNAKTFDQLGIDFKANSWLHVGIVLSEDKILCYLNKIKVEFPRYEKASDKITITLNQDGADLKNTFILDELFIDDSIAEAFEDFAKNTDARIAWAALSKDEKHFILDADGFETNIFTNAGIVGTDYISDERAKAIAEEVLRG